MALREYNKLMRLSYKSPGRAAYKIKNQSSAAGTARVRAARARYMAMMKAKMAQKDRQRELDQERGGHHMVVPGNFNSNFHQHRRENALAKKAQFGGNDRHANTTGAGAEAEVLTEAPHRPAFRLHDRVKALWEGGPDIFAGRISDVSVDHIAGPIYGIKYVPFHR